MKAKYKKFLIICGKALMLLCLAAFVLVCVFYYVSPKDEAQTIRAKAEEVAANAAPITQSRASSGIDLSKYPTANLMPLSLALQNCTYNNGVVTQIVADTTTVRSWKVITMVIYSKTSNGSLMGT